MKAKSHEISDSEFVVRLPSELTPQAAAGKLQGVASLEPLAGHPGLHIVSLASGAASPKKGWELLRKKLGGKVEVSPVFLDEDQTPRYAVGTFQVRFPSPPSDAELHEWLPQGLRVKGRNEYMPAQVALEPEDPARQYLPDLLAALQQHIAEGVTVWPETLQRYRRG